jgi:seryl-tRNA synthetase
MEFNTGAADFKLNEGNREMNKLNDELKGYYTKKAKPPPELLAAKADLEARVKKEETAVREMHTLLQQYLSKIGNIVHPDVPISKDETNNRIVTEWGTPRPHTDELHHHHELLYRIGGYDPEAGARVAGHRGYFLTGPAVFLNQAIINYAMNFLRERGYTLMQTPFFMNRDVMARTAQLSDFDEQLYKVSGEGDDVKYLIATSEQPISAFHMGEHLPKERLPLCYAGYSTNFRKEAGGHGRDVWGIFRVHQFEKIEQFCITDPESSWEMHAKMIKNSEDFFQSLGIAYRVIDIVSGELNDAAARKYDLEGWFPCLNEFRELVSCSNCTDFQARNLEIRYGYKNEKDSKKQYVHMLNSTLAATSRVLCALLETYQQPDGIHLPAALHPFLPESLRVIPYTRELPDNLDVKKVAAAKAKGGKGKDKH